MATPTNSLDYYTTYTYHFELHIARTWSEVLDIATEIDPRPEHTTALNCSGSLVISTIKDAHHSIDNVRFKFDSPMVSSFGIAVPQSVVTFTVTEPGGCSFFEKLRRKMEELEVSVFSNAHFVLKIFFVCRDENNNITTLDPVSIPLVGISMSAKFDHRGGEYDMIMLPVTEALTTDMHSNQMTQAIGFANKDIHLTASTVQEALDLLQEKLNDNYNYYVDSLESDAKRRIRYIVEYDEGIGGEINLNNAESFAPGEPKKLSFSSKEPIVYMLQKIVMSSTEMNSMIAESKNSLNTEFYPGAAFPVYRVYHRLTDDELQVIYKIHLYEGRSGPDPSMDFEFNYLFSPDTPNVDVMSFDIKFENMFVWLDNLTHTATNTQTAHDPNVPKEEPGTFSKNTHVENKTQPRDERDAPDTSQTDIRQKGYDVIPPPGSPRTSDQGFIRYQYDAVEQAKLAFDSIAEIGGAHSGQQVFTIRGHYQLLNRIVAFPDMEAALGVQGSSWCKVNIKDRNGNDFFYRGWYLMLSVENIFQNGQFTQSISTIMVDKNLLDANTADNAGYDGSFWGIE